MSNWMLTAPASEVTAQLEHHFVQVLAKRDATLLPADAPRWVFLQWLAEQGWLLHGSQTGGLTELRPGRDGYGQPDEFSNTQGVYAASDGLWAMMHALRGPQVCQQSDMGLQLRQQGGTWSAMRYFLSLATRDAYITDAHSLLAPGFVYMLSRDGFYASPPYEHGGLGEVQEAHWVSRTPALPIMSVPVSPADFPLPVRLHDADTVKARSRSDPWGFPWLDDGRVEGES